MRSYLKLIRPFHWVKNVLIFVPLFFSGKLFNLNLFIQSLLGFVAFCFIASAVYIINDIQDADKDRLHPKKKFRPIASGKISKIKAKLFLGILIMVSVLILIEVSLANGNVLVTFAWPIIYLGLNVAYSNGLKNIPLIDVIILASGFVIRLIYGGVLVNIKLSNYLLLTVISASLFLGFGKRRNELKKSTKTRKVLEAYNLEFLDKIMYVFITLTLVFYSMWAIHINSYVVYTVPLTMIIVSYYCLLIEGTTSDGDPAEVLKSSKGLLGLLVLYACVLFLTLYI